MSHRWKSPRHIDPQVRRDERQIKVMALQIHDQATLDKLLEGSSRQMREMMLERIAPYLSFVPDVEKDLDCLQCGRKGGAVIAHECMLPVGEN